MSRSEQTFTQIRNREYSDRNFLQRFTHLFGGLSGHVQGTVAHAEGGGGGEGGGRADKKGGNSELHLDNLIQI